MHRHPRVDAVPERRQRVPRNSQAPEWPHVRNLRIIVGGYFQTGLTSLGALFSPSARPIVQVESQHPQPSQTITWSPRTIG